MKMDTDFHMTTGEGESSYVNNSMLQKKALFETKQVLQKAVKELCSDVLPRNLVVVDLGCSSGENTLILVSEVINAMSDKPLEVQFFLNDLPGNDFNYIFQSLETFKKSITVEHEGGTLPPFYIAGLPGSYYTRLFPSQSVHLFHSSYCLHWRSQLPAELDVNAKSTYPNKGNIYIAKTTPLSVVKMYKELFKMDLLLFLKLRYEELACSGQIVLTFLGRKDEDAYKGELNHLCELLAQSIQSLVHKGLVEEEKLDAFNVPLYAPSLDEVTAVVRKSELFDITCAKLFESNWDPYDDSPGDVVQDSLQSGMNVAKGIRAVVEPFLSSYFGGSVLDELFKEYERNIAKHLQREKTMYSVITLSMQRR